MEKKKEKLDPEDIEELKNAGFNNISQLQNQPKFIIKNNKDEDDEENENSKKENTKKDKAPKTRFGNNELTDILMRKNN